MEKSAFMLTVTKTTLLVKKGGRDAVLWLSTIKSRFGIDISLLDKTTGRPLSVLDTKYKSATQVQPSDVAQVVTCAEMKNASDAVLLYPEVPSSAFAATIGSIGIRSMSFPLAQTLDVSGFAVLD